MPEKFENRENREGEIDALIENLAQTEGMNPDDIFSDIITFAGLAREDDNVRAYFEEMAEKIGISIGEMVDYAVKKLD